MAKIEVNHGAPGLKSDEQAKGDLSGIIGMVGSQTKGSLAISLEKRLALEIFANMVGERVEEVGDEVTDMVGEITNMVCGGAKRELADKGYDFELATPTVISGPDHTIHHKAEGTKLVIPFTTSFGNAYVEICFDK